METRPKIIVHWVKDVSRKNTSLKDTWNHLQLFCVLMVTFSEGKGLAEVEEGDSKDTLACDDDAHKADVCTQSHVFYESRSY